MHWRADSARLGRSYTCASIGNRTQSTEGTTPSPRTSTYNPYPIDNPLNQYDRVETTGGGTSATTAQGYRYDEDGNMLDAYIAADMDCNGVINASDNTAFLLYLNDPFQYGLQHPGCNPLHGDMDGDADTDWDDYDLFVDWLTGHSGAGGTRQVYAWDAENRLIAVGPPPDETPLAGAKRAEYRRRAYRPQCANQEGPADLDAASRRQHPETGRRQHPETGHRLRRTVTASSVSPTRRPLAGLSVPSSGCRQTSVDGLPLHAARLSGTRVPPAQGLPPSAASTIAKIPARTAAGGVGHAA